MEMHQIRYFLAVAEHLNFTRAAEACNVSQPSLTRAIKALEDELGGALFHRERNQTHLTDLGRSVHPNLSQVFAQTEAAKSLAKDMRTLKAAPLSLGVMCTIGPVRLVEMIRGFHQRHPGIDLSLRDGTGVALQKMLLEGELDAAIYGLPSELDERLHARPLFSERFMVTVAPGHRFERLNAVPMRELEGERYLNRANCEFIAHIRGLLDERGIGIIRSCRSERDDWIQSLTLAGFGFGLTPEFALAAPGIVARPLVDPDVSRTINLVTVRGRPHSPAIAALVQDATGFRWSP